MPTQRFLLPLGFVGVLAFLLLGTLTVAGAFAQEDPFPVTLTMTGPTTAEPGQEITYRLRYELTDPATVSSTAIVIGTTQGATHVSTQVISGPPGVLRQQTELLYRWSDLGRNSTETEGEIELVVRVDDGFVGSVFGNAYVPGTGTTASNIVETRVFTPGMLPKAGGGGSVAGSLSPVILALVMLAGVALLCTGAAARLTWRAK